MAIYDTLAGSVECSSKEKRKNRHGRQRRAITTTATGEIKKQAERDSVWSWVESRELNTNITIIQMIYFFMNDGDVKYVYDP